jgi:hypothetical protein
MGWSVVGMSRCSPSRWTPRRASPQVREDHPHSRPETTASLRFRGPPSIDEFTQRRIDQLECVIQELQRRVEHLEGRLSSNGRDSPLRGGSMRVDPNVRYCNLCDKYYQFQIASQHFDGRRHKLHVKKLMDEGEWDELNRHAELARNAGCDTPVEIYGRASRLHVSSPFATASRIPPSRGEHDGSSRVEKRVVF